MDKRIIKALPDVVIRLNQNKIYNVGAFLGFDACIDYIVRIVREKKEDTDTGYFTSSRQFGDFLIGLDNNSCGVELETKLSKTGGNMVITANALGNLGIKVECVGTFGYPDILPVFRTISGNCSIHTVGDTISATALEFNDSKVIIFDPGPYKKLDWEGIKDILGIDTIKQLISGKKLISFLNWSEIENSSRIWEGILEEILPDLIPTVECPFFFTDFSDCSRRSGKDIRFAIDLLGRFRNYFKVIISLNQNETELISWALDLSPGSSDEDFIKTLFSKANVDVLIIHRVKDAIAFDGTTFEKCDTFFCNDPLILTGGGDNFNAGFCYALFHDLDLFQSLLVANAVSGSYVKTGISPNVNALKAFLGKTLKVNSRHEIH